MVRHLGYICRGTIKILVQHYQVFALSDIIEWHISHRVVLVLITAVPVRNGYGGSNEKGISKLILDISDI